MTRQRFIHRAIETANNSSMSCKHGSILVKGGKIVSTGFNSNRTRINKTNVCSIHAEMASLYNASRKQCSGSTIYIVRMKTIIQKHNGKIIEKKATCNSQPCCNCIKTLFKYNVKKVCYSVGDDMFVTEKVSKLINSTNHISRGQRLLNKKQINLFNKK